MYSHARRFSLHRAKASWRSVTSPVKLAIPETLARKRAALRLLRAREARGLSQEQLAAELGISKRAYGSIERGQVRAIGLEALVFLEGGTHAASPVKAEAVSDHRSHQPKRFEPVAPGGQIRATNFAERSPSTQDIGAAALKRSDTRGEHTAQACGAMASELCSRGAPTVCIVQIERPVARCASASLSRVLLPVRKAGSKHSERDLDLNEETRRADAEHPENGGVRKTSLPIPETAGSVNLLQDGAAVARRAHNPKAEGSSPSPATKRRAA